jgi:hypothetical protein
MSESDKTKFKKAAAGIASTVILETTPPHFHLQFQDDEMQYMKFVVYACLTIIVSCSLSSNSNNSLYTPNTFDVEEGALNKGILRVYLPEKTPKNLAIQAPNGEWFVLQDSEESIEIMPQARFESVKIMEFQIEKLKGVTWRESKRVTELVFKASGDYLVYFADNLETESENTFSLQETINFLKKY